MNLQRILSSTPTFIITLDRCDYCFKAKGLLNKLGYNFTVYRTEEYPELSDEVYRSTGLRTFPKIYINGSYVGGCDDLEMKIERNEL